MGSTTKNASQLEEAKFVLPALPAWRPRQAPCLNWVTVKELQGLCLGYIGIMEKKMETTMVQGVGFRV